MGLHEKSSHKKKKSGNDAVGKKIAELKKEGIPPKQAVAKAINMVGKKKRNKKKSFLDFLPDK